MRIFVQPAGVIKSVLYHEAFWIKCESAFLFGSHSMCYPFCITYCCRLVSQSAKTLLVSHVEYLPIVSTDNNKMASSSSADFQLQPSSTPWRFLGICCRCLVALAWLIHYCIPSCQHSSYFGHIHIYNAHMRRRCRNTLHCMAYLAWKLCLLLQMYQQSEAITYKEGCWHDPHFSHLKNL